MHLIEHGVEVLDEIGRSCAVEGTRQALRWLERHARHREDTEIVEWEDRQGKSPSARTPEQIQQAREAEESAARIVGLLQTGDLEENKVFSPQIMDRIDLVYRDTLHGVVDTWMNPGAKRWAEQWKKYQSQLMKLLPEWWAQTGCFPDLARSDVASARLEIALKRKDRPAFPLITNTVILDVAKLLMAEQIGVEQVSSAFLLFFPRERARLEAHPLAHTQLIGSPMCLRS